MVRLTKTQYYNINNIFINKSCVINYKINCIVMLKYYNNQIWVDILETYYLKHYFHHAKKLSNY